MVKDMTLSTLRVDEVRVVLLSPHRLEEDHSLRGLSEVALLSGLLVDADEEEAVVPRVEHPLGDGDDVPVVLRLGSRDQNREALLRLEGCALLQGGLHLLHLDQILRVGLTGGELGRQVQLDREASVEGMRADRAETRLDRIHVDDHLFFSLSCMCGASRD